MSWLGMAHSAPSIAPRRGMEMMKTMGVSVVTLAGGEVIPALERRRKEGSLEVDSDERGEPQHVDLHRRDDRLHERHEDQDDRWPLEGPAEQEDDDHDEGEPCQRANVPRE